MSMIRQSPGFLASALVGALLVIKPGAADGTCVPATAPTDLIIGVSDGLAKDAGEMVDAASAGVADVLCGAAVTRGQKLTCDATSRAVPCAPGVGINHQSFGTALQSGVAGDVILYQVGLSTVQG
jgi:hypothetical protein